MQGEHEQEPLQRASIMELVLENLRFQAIRMTGVLHYRPALCRFPSHEEGDSDNAFVSHDSDLCRLAVFHYIKDRNDAVDRKICMAHYLTGVVEDLAQRQRRQLQLIDKAVPLGIGQCAENGVLLRPTLYPRKILQFRLRTSVCDTGIGRSRVCLWTSPS